MSEYVTRRTEALAKLVEEHGFSGLDAERLLREWEFEANRRGLDQRQRSFWDVGVEWMAEQMRHRRDADSTAD